MRQVTVVGRVCLALLLITGTVLSQTSTGKSASNKSHTTKTNSVAARLEQMEKAIEGQQQMIQQLQDQLKGRDSQVQQLQQQLTQTQASVNQAMQESQQSQAAAAKSVQPEQLDVVKRDVDDLRGNASNVALSLQETQKAFHDQTENPLAIHFKGITITPGGFLAAESVYRNHALGSDINTPFNSINMPGAGQNAVSEFFASGRQSRVSMLAEGKLKNLKMTGYFEADFLSAGVTSNNNESNSYTMRQRQVWGQAASDRWTFTGGQMWSLMTETKKGMDNRSEALPMTIDPQYHVGFSWARQPGFRVVRNFNNRFWLGASLENPQTTFAARNNASNFAFGSAGVGGGLYNLNANYSFNAMPDFIFKAAAEPGFGHYEVFAILSRFRDRVYPCAEPPLVSNCGTSPSALGAYNDSQTAAGIGGNARITLFKQFDIGVHALTGQGMGRYGTAGLPDSTINPDGTLALLRSYQGLATVEWHTKRLDLYMNAGEEYVQKRWQYDPNNPNSPTTPVGYGSPLFNVSGCYTETVPGSGGGFGFGGLSKCSADTKSVVEGTVGFWIKVHNGPHGRLQFGPQYSYVSRNSWEGTNGTGFSAPHGVENMFFTSFRYYLP